MKIKKLLPYLLISCLGAFLLYRIYGQVNLKELIETFKEVRIEWVILATIAHLINHYLRAFRWQRLVAVQGYTLSVLDSFLGEMSGFLINLVPPRMGEWMRCVILKRLKGIPISVSFGGVIVERLLDISLFILLFTFTVGLELATGSKMLTSLWGRGTPMGDHKIYYVIGGGVAALLFLGLAYKWKAHLKQIIWMKISAFVKDVMEAIRQMRRCNRLMLLSSSSFILFFNFLVEYLSFYAIEEINISYKGALWVFIAMTVGMAIPSPGGLGTYHAGVMTVLLALGTEPKYAIAYTTITHSIQIFNAVVVGGLSFLTANVLARRRKNEE
ncbi:MAG: lysylphosphatidylglycerol synthase transmembrane domain-containing protein [Bacteroidota bacterium]